MRKPQPAIPAVRDAFEAVNEGDIGEFENELGATLPVDYRRFILSTNGGCVYDSVVPNIGDTIRTFYALNCDYDWADLRWARAACSQWLPSSLLPIASGGEGDQYCLSLEPNTRGQVYHVMAEWPFADSEGADMTAVADSFNAFLTSIQIDASRIVSECDHNNVSFAAEVGDIEWLRDMARMHPMVVSRRNSRGESLLHRAVFRCQLEVAEWLMSIGQDIEARDYNGDSPFFTAVYCGSIDAVRLLIAHGCDINALSADGRVPLFEALKCKQIRCAIELLIAMVRSSGAEQYRGVVRELCEGDEELMKHLAPIVGGLWRWRE